MKEKSSLHHIPIYDVGLEVVAAEDVNEAAASKRRLAHFDGAGETPAVACVLSREKKLSLILPSKGLTHSLIAHELAHITAQVCNMNGCPPSSGQNEHEALIAEYVAGLVYGELNGWRISIR